MTEQASENIDQAAPYYKVQGFANFVSAEAPEKLFYNACSECKRKLYEQTEGWKCENCNKFYTEPVPTYMFSAKIQDFSGDCYLQFMREQGENFLGMSATDLKNLIEEEDPHKIREVINASCYKVSLELYFAERAGYCKAPNGRETRRHERLRKHTVAQVLRDESAADDLERRQPEAAGEAAVLRGHVRSLIT